MLDPPNYHPLQHFIDVDYTIEIIILHFWVDLYSIYLYQIHSQCLNSYFANIMRTILDYSLYLLFRLPDNSVFPLFLYLCHIIVHHLFCFQIFNYLENRLILYFDPRNINNRNFDFTAHYLFSKLCYISKCL